MSQAFGLSDAMDAVVGIPNVSQSRGKRRSSDSVIEADGAEFGPPERNPGAGQASGAIGRSGASDRLPGCRRAHIQKRLQVARPLAVYRHIVCNRGKTMSQHEVDERTNLTNNNRFELLLFRLGESQRAGQRELFGINVFKVREIMVMPPVTHVADAGAHILGAVNVRGQIIPVIDLASVIGCKNGNANILLITEYARSTQGFAVEEVDEIVRLEWSQIFPAEASVGSANITSLARLDGNADNSRLAQVIDVEQILVDVFPTRRADLAPDSDGRAIKLPPGAKLLVADDSGLARSLIASGLDAMGAPFVMTKSGQEAWDTLQNIARDAAREGKTVRDKIALVLTDLEMPEMDGFTLTRKIKSEPAFQSIPVVIHSSLSGSANEDHVRRVGANGYVAKFEANELAQAIVSALG